MNICCIILLLQHWLHGKQVYLLYCHDFHTLLSSINNKFFLSLDLLSIETQPDCKSATSLKLPTRLLSSNFQHKDIHNGSDDCVSNCLTILATSYSMQPKLELVRKQAASCCSPAGSVGIRQDNYLSCCCLTTYLVTRYLPALVMPGCLCMME